MRVIVEYLYCVAFGEEVLTLKILFCNSLYDTMRLHFKKGSRHNVTL